jgi:hypothetical protein
MPPFAFGLAEIRQRAGRPLLERKGILVGFRKMEKRDGAVDQSADFVQSPGQQFIHGMRCGIFDQPGTDFLRLSNEFAFGALMFHDLSSHAGG